MNAAPELGLSPIPAAHRGKCGCGLCSAHRVAKATKRLEMGHYDIPKVVDKAFDGLLDDLLPGEPAPAWD